MKTIKKASLALSVSAALLSTAVVAQEENQDETSLELETIMVTAQKRTQNIQEVPISVAAMTPKELDTIGAGALDVRALSARVPSLLIESSFGRTFPRFYIRGLGNTDFDLLASQPVSLIYDDVVLENPLTKGFPMFDMEQVEVLRGPQGTLFGRNTPAGIVKVASAKPSQEFDAHVNMSYGTNSTRDFDIAIGGGLSDTISTRVSLLSQNRSDYIDNRAPGFEADDQLGGFDEKAVKFQLLYEPNDKFSGLLMYRVRNAQADARIFRANIIKPGTNDLVDNFNFDTVFQDAASRNIQKVDQTGISLKLEYDMGQHTFTSVTAVEEAEILSVGDIDGGYGASFVNQMGPGFIPFASETGASMPDHKQITQEWRLASNDIGKLDYQLGFFYFGEELTVNNLSFDSLFSQAQNGQTTQEAKTTAWGAFISTDYDVSDKLTITSGIRYSDDEKDWSGRLDQAVPFVSPLSAGATASDTVEDSQISFDVSGTYKYTDTTNVYARIARGYRAPSIRGNLLFDTAPTKADSETILSGEMGFKSRIWDNTARWNGSVFMYQVSDQQLTAVGGGSNVARLVNADKTNAYGFEMDIEAAVSENWFLTGGISYNHTEIDDANLAIAPCGGGCTVTDPTVIRTADGQDLADTAENAGLGTRVALLDGNSLPQAPEWILNFTARYEQELGEGNLFAYTDWAYRSEVNFFLYESVEFTGKSLLEGGIRAGYEWYTDNGDYEIAVFGRNITGEEQLTGAIDFNNLTGYVNEPTFWGVEFISNFY
ncbi:MAG: TonB-dependent receptor [Alteromonadaceae bacterium]|nr:TonB-dependent receptor [Alteromonadaceae bacterium]